MSKGLCGLSVQWPAISGVGISATIDKNITISICFSIDSEMMKAALKKVTSFVPRC